MADNLDHLRVSALTERSNSGTISLISFCLNWGEISGVRGEVKPISLLHRDDRRVPFDLSIFLNDGRQHDCCEDGNGKDKVQGFLAKLQVQGASASLYREH